MLLVIIDSSYVKRALQFRDRFTNVATGVYVAGKIRSQVRSVFNLVLALLATCIFVL